MSNKPDYHIQIIKLILLGFYEKTMERKYCQSLEKQTSILFFVEVFKYKDIY
jgi:hypothetical protein